LIRFTAAATTTAGRTRGRAADPADSPARGRRIAGLANPTELRCALRAELTDDFPLATVEKRAVLLAA
jgi:hypothetical protein